MDIQMPVMDGIEATREIRKLEEMNVISGFSPATPSQMPMDASTPSSSFTGDPRPTSASSPYRSSVIIVALTASSLQSDRVSALAAGCNDFLTKPVSLLWLNNKIIEWGSIKALQMWADVRPEAVRKMSRGQAAQARAVAERLQLPPKTRKSPSRRLPVTEKSVPSSEPLATATAATVPSAAAAVEYLTRSTNQENNDMPPCSSTGAEESALIPSALPKRRRSQKRDSPPESLKMKAREIVEGKRSIGDSIFKPYLIIAQQKLMV